MSQQRTCLVIYLPYQFVTFILRRIDFSDLASSFRNLQWRIDYDSLTKTNLFLMVDSPLLPSVVLGKNEKRIKDTFAQYETGMEVTGSNGLSGGYKVTVRRKTTKEMVFYCTPGNNKALTSQMWWCQE